MRRLQEATGTRVSGLCVFPLLSSIFLGPRKKCPQEASRRTPASPFCCRCCCCWSKRRSPALARCCSFDPCRPNPFNLQACGGPIILIGSWVPREGGPEGPRRGRDVPCWERSEPGEDQRRLLELLNGGAQGRAEKFGRVRVVVCCAFFVSQ